MFNARAAALKPSDRARRFFLQFDAWTSSELLALLDDPGFVASLRPPTRRLFATVRPTLPFSRPTAFFEMALMLSKQAVSRAERMVRGMELTPPLPEPIDERPPLPCASHPQALLRMAKYLERIFEHGFPGVHAAPNDGAPWRAFVAAFAAFGSGALATLAPTPLGGWPTPLNTEPDGAYFFLFAEFALRRVELAWSPFWFRTARLFVALEDLFDAAYEWPMMRRNLQEYSRKPGPAKPRIDAFMQHLARFEADFKGRATLTRLTRVHALNVCHANRDEIVAGFPPQSG